MEQGSLRHRAGGSWVHTAEFLWLQLSVTACLRVSAVPAALQGAEGETLGFPLSRHCIRMSLAQGPGLSPGMLQALLLSWAAWKLHTW